MADKWLKYFPHTPTHGKGTLKISVKSSQYTIPARSSFKNEFPVVKFQFWRFLAFFSAAAHWQLQIASRDGAFPDFVASIYFFSTIIPNEPSKSQCTNPPWIYFSPSQPRAAHPLNTHWQCLVLYKEVTSSVCTSVAILTTVIRLFVRRLIFWFDDVSRFPWSRPNYPENLLVDWPVNI